MTSAYVAGQQIMARDVASHRWRPAHVHRPEPYSKAGCDGAYVLWDDLSVERDGSESSGGWCSAALIHPRRVDEATVALWHLGFVLRCVGEFAAQRQRRKEVRA